MNRREFMKSTLVAAGIGTVGQFSVSPAALGKETGLDAHGRPAALEPIRGFVPRFTPVTDGPADPENYTLNYDVVHWRGGREDAAKSGVVGSLKIERHAREDAVHYRISQDIGFGGRRNILQAGIVCSPGLLETLRSWDLHAFSRDANGNKMPLSVMSEKGRNSAGQIRIEGSNYSYEHSSNRPVVSQWTILHRFLGGMDGGTRAEFDLMHDLSVFKPAQELSYDGEIEAKVKGGRRVKFDTYLQLGEGTLPIHYVLGDAGRPQFVTAAMLSWALTGVD